MKSLPEIDFIESPTDRALHENCRYFRKVVPLLFEDFALKANELGIVPDFHYVEPKLSRFVLNKVTGKSNITKGWGLLRHDSEPDSYCMLTATSEGEVLDVLYKTIKTPDSRIEKVIPNRGCTLMIVGAATADEYIAEIRANIEHKILDHLKGQL